MPIIPNEARSGLPAGATYCQFFDFPKYMDEEEGKSKKQMCGLTPEND